MELKITMKDIKEIEKKLPDLASWLTSHFASYNACAVILSTVVDKVQEIKTVLQEDE